MNSKDLEKKYETRDIRLVSPAIKYTADDNCVMICGKTTAFKPVPSKDPNEYEFSCRFLVSKAAFKDNGMEKALRSSAFEVVTMVQVPERTLAKAVLIGVEDTNKRGSWQVIAPKSKQDPEEDLPEIKTGDGLFTEESIQKIRDQLVCVWSHDVDGVQKRYRILLSVGSIMGEDSKRYGLFLNEEFVLGSDHFEVLAKKAEEMING